MLHVRHRNVDASHLRYLPGITAGGIDHDLSTHSSLVGDHIPFTGGQLAQAGYQRLADNGCTQIFGTDCHSVAQTRRVGVTVARGIGPRDHPIGRQKRVDPPDFLRRNNLHVEANDLGITVDIFEPRQLPLIGSQTDATRLMPTHILPGQSFEPGVQIVAVGMDFRKIVAAGDTRALARRMPGRPRGELVLLDQHTIGPTELGEMIEQAHPHDPTADNDNTRL